MAPGQEGYGDWVEKHYEFVTVSWATWTGPIPSSLAQVFRAHPPKPTGHFDGVTQTWVMMYQMQNMNLKVDGRVDPILPSQSPAHPTTLMLLNAHMRALGGGLRISRMPPILQGKIIPD